MRRALTYLTAFVLLLASLTVGVFTADLPFWLRAMRLPVTGDEAYLPTVAIGEPQAQSAAPLPVSVDSAVAGIDAAALEAAVARASESGSRALLVMRGGEPLLSRYFGADDDGSLMPAGLIARPVAAMAVGLALADRSITSLDEPIARFLPEWDDEPRGRITPRQLLEDTSGIETGGDTRGLLRRSPWQEPSRLPAFATSKGVRLLLGNDFARTALRFDLEHESGGFHNVSPANTQVVALILERTTGLPYETFIDQRLWRPAGAGPAELGFDRRAGMPAAHCCWRATAPGVARIVSLLATDGVSRGRQVLPAGWVQEMARASRVNAGSGMQLTRLEIDGALALGGGDDQDNMFWVIPERQLAIVNIVNAQGTTPPELAELLVPALTRSK